MEPKRLIDGREDCFQDDEEGLGRARGGGYLVTEWRFGQNVEVLGHHRLCRQQRSEATHSFSGNAETQ